MIWFLGFLVGSAVVLYIGYRLPARKIKRTQFGYDDPLVRDGEQVALLTLEQLYQNN